MKHLSSSYYSSVMSNKIYHQRSFTSYRILFVNPNKVKNNQQQNLCIIIWVFQNNQLHPLRCPGISMLSSKSKSFTIQLWSINNLNLLLKSTTFKESNFHTQKWRLYLSNISNINPIKFSFHQYKTEWVNEWKIMNIKLNAILRGTNQYWRPKSWCKNNDALKLCLR